ncbi:MAG: type IX secretion system membrane protein PorP/SprF [Bacteroidetes bacterium]|nr:type IX secretion system membrane protein PorP/SprF [Bacteroidota bacterium]MDA0902926.1 type IX secretion system membrane protein PorP/SprF [Bacteroidota bacterium]MDA1241658.1 type IX secretion system membrane protein PorP/SprF [Bacteroidota bacterium]
MTKTFSCILLLALVSTFALTLSVPQAHAQDPEFSQFYANPLLLNPAFAGSARGPRFVMTHRNQWPAMSGAYVTQAVGYDQHFNSIQGGLGLVVMNDQAGQNTLTTTRITGMYSYQQAITRKLSLRAALEASYFQKALDWSNLTFGDMIDPRRGFIYETADTPRGGTVKKVDFGAGLLAFTEKFYVGAAAVHLNEPNESLVVGVSRLPMKITGHAGAKLPLQRSVKGVEAWISPNVLYRLQGEFQQLNVGTYVSKGPLVGGVWYRGFFSENNHDALIVLVGVETPLMRFGYSYDITISDLTPATGGAHELSLSMKFQTAQRSKFRTVDCPTF